LCFLPALPLANGANKTKRAARACARPPPRHFGTAQKADPESTSPVRDHGFRACRLQQRPRLAEAWRLPWAAARARPRFLDLAQHPARPRALGYPRAFENAETWPGIAAEQDITGIPALLLLHRGRPTDAGYF